MKRLALVLIASTLLITACTTTGNNQHNPTATDSNGNSHPTSLSLSAEDTSFIGIDTANEMIQSYLTSIQGNDSNLHSLIVDANALRRYLNTDSGKTISHMKIMFAHRLSYIHSGHQGQPCGYNVNGLTAILAGYNDAGNYVYYSNETVEDNLGQCPVFCPTQGTAANNTLVR